MKTVQFDQIDLGGGVFATHAWLSDGPIALVAARIGHGGEKKSRLDLQKAMFIDPLPGERSTDGLRALIARLRTFTLR